MLEERDLGIGNINDERAAVNLLERLEEAICEADGRRARRRPRLRRRAAIVPTSDYGDVHG